MGGVGRAWTWSQTSRTNKFHTRRAWRLTVWGSWTSARTASALNRPSFTAGSLRQSANQFVKTGLLHPVAQGSVEAPFGTLENFRRAALTQSFLSKILKSCDSV